MKALRQLWKNREQIAEGIQNSLFRQEHIELIAKQRLKICQDCDTIDYDGKGCLIPLTGPCCDLNKGGCGCSLQYKLRSLSSDCPKHHWSAVMSEEEENKLIGTLNQDNQP